MAQKITNKEIKIGTVLKATHIEDDAPYVLNRFYKASDIDTKSYEGQISIEIDNHIGYSYFRSEIENYFEIIESIDDIEDLEHKALILKETFEQMKQMSESAEDEISDELLINETIAFLVQDEVYQCDEIELRFICDNMDITMVERCSCCGKVLMPDDECYSDELNDNDAALCDDCSIYNDQTDMYQKSVHQDVIEKLTGYKFSPHLGNVGSKIEEFNYWLNKHEHKFGYKEPNNEDILIEFINEYTEWNTCDCCKLIEKSKELKWLQQDELSTDEQNVANFITCLYENILAMCDNCINMFISRTKLSLHDIVQRIKENQMIYRVGDLVVLEKVNFEEKNTSLKSYIDTIVSIDEKTKTYKLKSYDDVLFKEEDFYDIANEAYVSEYREFIANNYPDISEDVDEWSNVNYDGIPEIESAFVEFGYKDEFIEQLKVDNLPYGRLLTPKFNIGDSFTVHFDYYKDNEFTTHQIVKIDKSFTEADEIVYWDDNCVYITESELEKQKALLNKVLDETVIVKNELLEYIFCQDDDNGIVIPTYKELTEVDDYQSNWKLSNEYGDYSLSSLIYIVNEQSEKFFSIQKVLNGHREKFRKSKKYGYRQRVEFGSPIELVCELQEIFNIYSNGVINPETELVLLQDSKRTEDYSSIEILLQTPIKFDELSSHLKSTLDLEHHDEVNLLIEAIKQAKADNHETLCVYDC